MLKYLVIWLCLLAFAISAKHSSTRWRVRRSIWPFNSPSSSAQLESQPRTDTFNSALNNEELQMLRKSGLSHEKLDLSGRPLRRVHRNRGIGLRPVNPQAIDESELPQEPPPAVPPPPQKAPILPPPTAVSPSPEAPIPPAPEPLTMDPNFLEDLGDLADMVPEESSAQEGGDTGMFINLLQRFLKFFRFKRALLRQGPGLVWTLLGGLLGSNSFGGKQVPLGPLDRVDKPVTAYLPQTQGSYLAVALPRSGEVGGPQQLIGPKPPVPPVGPRSFRLQGQHQQPPRLESFAELPAGPDAAKEPIITRSGAYIRTQSLVQPWKSNAAHATHSMNPNLSAVPPPPSQRRSDEITNEQQFQKRIGEVESSSSTNATNDQETFSISTTERPSTTTTGFPNAPTKKIAIPSKASRDRLKEMISRLKLSENLMRRMNMSKADFEDIVNFDANNPSARTVERLRFLQREFHVRKAQMGPLLYGHMKRQIEKQLPPDVVEALKL